MEAQQFNKENVNYEDFMERLSLASQELMTRSPVAKAVMRRDAIKKLPPSSLAEDKRNPLTPISQNKEPQLLQIGSEAKSPVDSNSFQSTRSILYSLQGGSPNDPKKGRNMREFEDQLKQLRNENFSLKLRVYFLEERMTKQGNNQTKDKLCKENMELKVEVEALKRDVYEKQNIIRESSQLLKNLEQQTNNKVQNFQEQYEKQIKELDKKIALYEKELEQNDQPNCDLTGLCELAFKVDNSHDKSCLGKPVSQKTASGANVSQDQGIGSDCHNSILQEQLDEKNKRIAKLENDLTNLRAELEEQEEKIVYMEVEIKEKDERLQNTISAMHDYQMKSNQHQIDSLQKQLISGSDISQQMAEYEELLEEKMKEAHSLNELVTQTEDELAMQKELYGKLQQELISAQKVIQDQSNLSLPLRELMTKSLSLEEENNELKKSIVKKDKQIKTLVGELKETLEFVEQTSESEANAESADKNALYANLSNDIRKMNIEIEQITKDSENRVKSLVDQLDATEAELLKVKESLDVATKTNDEQAELCERQKAEIEQLKSTINPISQSCRNQLVSLVISLKDDLVSIHERIEKLTEKDNAQQLMNYIKELRKRLSKSSSAAESLKSQLEVLVGFFEELLQSDNILLNSMSSTRRNSLMKSLDDSRSLSQSVLEETTFNETVDVTNESIDFIFMEEVNAICNDFKEKLSTIDNIMDILSANTDDSSGSLHISALQHVPSSDLPRGVFMSLDCIPTSDKIVTERLAVTEPNYEPVPDKVTQTNTEWTDIFDKQNADNIIKSLQYDIDQLQRNISEKQTINELKERLSGSLDISETESRFLKCVCKLRELLGLRSSTSLGPDEVVRGLEDCLLAAHHMVVKYKALKLSVENKPAVKSDELSLKKITMLKTSHLSLEKSYADLKLKCEDLQQTNDILENKIKAAYQECDEKLKEEKIRAMHLQSLVEALQVQLERGFDGSSLGSSTSASSSFYQQSFNEDNIIVDHEQVDLRNPNNNSETDCRKWAMVNDTLEVLKEDCRIPDHANLVSENSRLMKLNEELESRLGMTKNNLKDALDELHVAAERKKSVQVAMAKHVSQSHKVLSKASGYMAMAKGTKKHAKQ